MTIDHNGGHIKKSHVVTEEETIMRIDTTEQPETDIRVHVENVTL